MSSRSSAGSGRLPRQTAMTAVFLIIDAAFLGAHLIKIADGG
jgi:K+ transporter